MPNSPAFVVFYHGILKAGGTVVNFNPLYSQEELELQARDSGAKIMVTLDLAVTFDKVEALLASGAIDKAVVVSFASLLPRLKAIGMKLKRGPKLGQIASSPQKAKIVAEQDLLANDGDYRKPAIGTDAIAVLQYTGGTTGTPKGAMLTHANLSINVKQVMAWRGQTMAPGDGIIGVLPLFHVFAMTTVMNFGIGQGMEMILLPRFELIETLKLITKLKPKMMPGVPTLFNAMLQHPHIRDFDLTSLEFCISGGAGLPIEVKRGFETMCGCTLTEGYGLSETSPVAACNPHDRPPKGRLDRPAASRHRFQHPLARGPDGRGRKGRGRRDLHRRAAGDGGLLEQARGDGERVRRAILPHRRRGLHGRRGLHLHRRSHQGHDQRLWLQGLSARIEDVLYEHPAVEEVTVIGIPDAYRGEAPKAFIKLKEGVQATKAELHRVPEAAAVEDRIAGRDRIPRQPAKDARRQALQEGAARRAGGEKPIGLALERWPRGRSR